MWEGLDFGDPFPGFPLRVSLSIPRGSAGTFFVLFVVEDHPQWELHGSEAGAWVGASVLARQVVIMVAPGHDVGQFVGWYFHGGRA